VEKEWLYDTPAYPFIPSPKLQVIYEDEAAN
jgi:hypothetical protein